jgi:hypothetical protein
MLLLPSAFASPPHGQLASPVATIAGANHTRVHFLVVGDLHGGPGRRAFPDWGEYGHYKPLHNLLVSGVRASALTKSRIERRASAPEFRLRQVMQ